MNALTKKDHRKEMRIRKKKWFKHVPDRRSNMEKVIEKLEYEQPSTVL